MAGTIKGIIVEIGGDTSGLQKALRSVNTATSSLTKELRGINSLLKLDPSNTELVSQKQKVLAENIEQTSKKLEELRKVQEMADEKIKNGGKISQENYRNLQREIINTENKLKDLQVQASKWTQAGDSLEAFGTKVTNISNKIDNLGNTLTTSLTLPVLAIGTAAVTTGNDFEAQMSRVQAIAGATKDELEQLTNQAIDLGASTSFSASEVAAGMENLASAGFTTNEIMEAMPGLLNLAASSGAELATAAEIAASAIRGFGLEANQSAHVADVFAEAAARTNAQTEDMGNAMKYIAPVANTMGLKIEEVAAAIGIMSDAGIKGEQAGTTLRGALTRLTKPTDKMVKVMENLGISFYDNEGKMKSLTEMISMLQNATANLTDEQEQNALTTLFGTESLSGMVALINRGSGDLADMTKSFEDCDGAAQDMADTMLDNTKGSIEELSGSLESAGIAIQQALAPEIKDLAKWIQDLVDDFNDLSEEEKQNIVRTELLVAAIGPAVKILGTLGKGLGTVTTGLGKFSKAIAVAKAGTVSTDVSVNSLAQKIGFLTTPTGLATTAIVALTAAYAANYVATTKEKAALGGLREEVENQTETWKQLKDTRETTLSSSLAEIETTQKLADELKKIVDENGKVKQGYEDRVQVILNQLNTALGTEYKLNGNIIGQYQELKNNIDNLIAAKKAEAVLNAYQEEYGAAIKGQAEATETLVGLKKQLAEASEQIATGDAKQRKEAEILYSSIAQKIGEQTTLISEYGKTISDVENLQTASVTGSAEEINNAITQLGTSYERASQQAQSTTEQQIQSQTEYVSYLKQSLSDAEKANDVYQQNILNSQLNTEQKKLESLANSLVEQTSTIEELTPEQLEAWKAISDSSYSIYSNSLMKLPEETRTRIEEATGVIALDTSMQDAAEQKGTSVTTYFSRNLKIADKAIDELNSTSNEIDSNTSVGIAFQNKGIDANNKFTENINYEKGKSATSDYLEGANEGGNESKWSFWDLLFGIGKQGNQSMRKGLGDGSPSVLAKEAVIDYFLGADIGAKKQGPKTVKNIEEYAKQINQNFGKTLGSANLGINNKLGAINSKIINGTKTVYTTPQIIFNVQKMNEENLQECFNFINRKFGSQY